MKKRLNYLLLVLCLLVASACKKQSFRVEDYLLKRLKVYRIRDWAFEGNYIQTGEQYLQLRYIPAWIK